MAFPCMNIQNFPIYFKLSLFFIVIPIVVPYFGGKKSSPEPVSPSLSDNPRVTKVYTLQQIRKIKNHMIEVFSNLGRFMSSFQKIKSNSIRHGWKIKVSLGTCGYCIHHVSMSYAYLYPIRIEGYMCPGGTEVYPAILVNYVYDMDSKRVQVEISMNIPSPKHSQHQ